MLEKLGILLITLFILGGCGKQRTAQESRTLLETDREFAAASLRLGPAEAFRDYMAKDALMLPDGGKPLRGRQSIYLRMQGGGSMQLSWEPREARVAESGELGYTWGTYKSESLSPGGDTVIRYGKYLNIWKKNSDGHWKLLVDMGNSSPPPR